jgi:hypothetical protein
MDILEQYYKLVDVKPAYYNLTQPFYTPSQKRFLFTVEDFVLWYDKDQELYFLQKPLVNGGNDIHAYKKAIIVEHTWN